MLRNNLMNTIDIPASVPKDKHGKYIGNFSLLTHDTGKLMLFAGDQKVEHLNDDYYGEGIAEDNNTPQHMFEIASKARIGCFATQLGLIAKYGQDFPNVTYLVKLNSKTHLVKTTQRDPISEALWSVQDVVEFKHQSGLKIAAVGYTVYLGSEFESVMLKEAAQIVWQAHQNGLLTVLWFYPRGKAVVNEKDAHLIAGAAGVAATLGSDFVKISPPKQEGANSAELLKEAVRAAGKTKLVCAGGSSAEPAEFFKQLYDQIHVGGASGNATGRNIHQKSLEEAIAMCNAISAITLDNKTVVDALGIYKNKI